MRQDGEDSFERGDGFGATVVVIEIPTASKTIVARVARSLGPRVQEGAAAVDLPGVG